MNLNKMYGLFLRHFYLIKSSLPRVLDLIYWPTIQIILWGFISKFFSICLILIVFAFIVNNYLTFAGDWPGAFTIYNSANIYSSFQFFLYVSAIIFPLISHTCP